MPPRSKHRPEKAGRETEVTTYRLSVEGPCYQSKKDAYARTPARLPRVSSNAFACGGCDTCEGSRREAFAALEEGLEKANADRAERLNGSSFLQAGQGNVITRTVREVRVGFETIMIMEHTERPRSWKCTGCGMAKLQKSAPCGDPTCRTNEARRDAVQRLKNRRGGGNVTLEDGTKGYLGSGRKIEVAKSHGFHAAQAK